MVQSLLARLGLGIFIYRLDEFGNIPSVHPSMASLEINRLDWSINRNCHAYPECAFQEATRFPVFTSQISTTSLAPVATNRPSADNATA